MKRGVPVSPGVAVARAFRVDDLAARRDAAALDAAGLAAEAARFDQAAAAAAGHAAVLARSLGIPAVSGLKGALRDIHSGDLVVLDGREGHVLVNPGPEVEAAYRKLQREYVDLRDRLVENRDLAAVTAD